MGDLRVSASAFPERFWTLVRGAVESNHDPTAIVMHTVQVLQRLERGGPGEPAGQVVAELYNLLRADVGQRYSPPELLAGQPMTQRSLVYALGILLYERLTGDHPFGGSPDLDGSAEVDYDALPPRLAGTIRRAMAARPEERFGNLAMMRIRLEEFTRGPASDNSPPGYTPQPRREARTPGRPIEGLPLAGTRRDTVRDLQPPVHGASQVGDIGRAATISAATPAPDTEVAEVPDEASAPEIPDELAFTADGPLQSTPPLGVPVKSAPPVPPSTTRERLVSAPPPRRGVPLAKRPWVWAASGAAAMGVLVFVLTRRPEPQPQPRPAAPAAERAAAPRPAPAPAPAPDPALDPSAKPGAFDPELGGNLIAERARVCFDANQVSAGLHFGFSALYGTDGRVKRVFLPARAELMEEEEVCLIRQASGVFAGGPPKQQTTVGYAVRLGKARTDVRIRSIR